MPFAVDLLQPPQQKAPQAPAFLDLPIHRFHDRLALGVDLGSLLASELAGHPGSGIGIAGQRPRFGGGGCPCSRRPVAM